MVMSTITCPDISIVIPAYNAQHHIVDRLGDIMRTIRPGSNIEFLFVNDGSTDKTIIAIMTAVAALNKTGYSAIHLGTDENRGTFEAERLGIERATGEYVFFQDVDDPININLIKELYDLRIAMPSNFHVTCPTRLIKPGWTEDQPPSGWILNVWHSLKGPVISALKSQQRRGLGAISRRSLFERHIIGEVYDSLARELIEAGIDRINSMQDAITITYMIGLGIFDSIVETAEPYLYTYQATGAVSSNWTQRDHDKPILMATTDFAIDRIHGANSERRYADYLQGIGEGT